MATEAPSWADQWGTGGIGALDEDHSVNSTKDNANNKKGNSGFSKAKAMATAGAQKLKNSTSTSFKWVKNKCQKKTDST
ncbi:hypothetical protein M9H77_25568 [Catharanthus roseus]|uniref:Uncharacterized protein n=1 Tax=Catharanthus roseus TaxID=4058 RepID=A0ACC0A8Q4_CATRO|nr:hypothetical protein M9H77_25568 [Catharanthus roseus]